MHYKLHSFCTLFCDFLCSAFHCHFRTGAWHPLTNLSGCLGTRGTRSNDGPAKSRVTYKNFALAELNSNQTMRRKEADLPPIPPEVAQRCFDMLDQNLIGNILRIGNLAHLDKRFK